MGVFSEEEEEDISANYYGEPVHFPFTMTASQLSGGTSSSPVSWMRRQAQKLFVHKACKGELKLGYKLFCTIQ